MANSRPRVNNAIEKQAREYQEAHPGTHYTAAREAVLNTSIEPQWSPSPLDRIIGQPEAKKQLKHLLASRLADKARRKWTEENNSSIKPASPTPVRLFLSGPPGVGKTEAASVVHELVSESDAPFHEVCATHLIGNTIGSSALLARRVLKEAKNGTLLIDGIEAFHYDDPFRNEVLDVLNTEIPSRTELSVIITGYNSDRINASPRSAREFFDMFTTVIPFTTITTHDAVEFARKLIHESGRIAGDDVFEEIRFAVEEMLSVSPNSGMPTLDRVGNLRFVRNMLESAERASDLRLEYKYNGNYTTVSTEELFTVTADDVRNAVTTIRNSIQ